MLCLTKEEGGYSPAYSLRLYTSLMGDSMFFYISTERRCDGGGLKSDNNYLSVPWVIVRTMSRSHDGEAADLPLPLPLDISFEQRLSQAEPK